MSSALAIIKATLLVVAGVFYYVQGTPPMPPATSKDQIYKGQPFERIARRSTFFNRVVVLIACFWDAFFTLAAAGTLHSDFDVLYKPPSAVNVTNIAALHPMFILGVGTTVLFSSLRFWCFHELGELFTFEVAIRPNHKLITTGAYAYVRHPSYTGSIGSFIGVLVIYFAPGSWNYECRGMATSVRWVVCFWTLLGLYARRALINRTFAEDDKLKDEFGQEWINYREKVPYRLIPYII